MMCYQLQCLNMYVVGSVYVYQLLKRVEIINGKERIRYH